METMNILNSSDKELKIGDVFTPISWAGFAIEKSGIFEQWIQGSKVFDPTMGEGNLLEGLIRYGLKNGYKIEDLPIHNLFGNELNTEYFENAKRKFIDNFNFDMSKNFFNEDILTLEIPPCDIIFGNPPWQNFVDLPETYKEKLKYYFYKYDLIENSQSLLLGGSRIDIAALIVQISIKKFLSEFGKAIFFLPLSIFLNDGANASFRTYKINDTPFRLEKIYDLNNEEVFPDVSTRYGLAIFLKNLESIFPIPYYQSENQQWKEFLAKPLFANTDPLSIFSESSLEKLESIQPIRLAKESTPRQGINAGGANDVYFFEEYQSINDKFVKVKNKNSEWNLLPQKFVFPLITANNFKSEGTKPTKWVLLPYNESGNPLDFNQIQSYPELAHYLEKNKEKLSNRKGVMLNTQIKRGVWWAMLGVGEYCFFPYKVVWEAYGKKSFNPTIFEGRWQANQSLQAFIPVKSIDEAQRIQAELSHKNIENYLLSLNMEGTMNWAQPGKIKKLLDFQDHSPSLFSNCA